MNYIYILKLTNNKYYIGKTQTVKNTIDNHFSGLECEYTKIYRPQLVISIEIEILPQIDIIKTIKRYINRFGMDNIYSDVKYDKSSIINTPLSSQQNKKVFKNTVLSINEKRCYDPLMDEVLKYNVEQVDGPSDNNDYDYINNDSDYDSDDNINNTNNCNWYCG